MDPAREQFDELFAEHARAVFRFAIRRVDAAAVEDVVSETFLIAWRRLADVPDGERARSWLFSTARWVIANHARSARRRAQLADRVAAQPTATAGDPADAVTDAVLVRRVLATLKPSDQEVLRLAEWDDLPAAECARLVGCSPATFAVRLHRARTRFTAALSAYEQRDSDQTPRQVNS